MPTITVEENDNKLLTFSEDKLAAVYHFVSYLAEADFNVEFLARRSKMTEAEAFEISEKIKADWWKKNKSRIEKMIAENE